MNDNEVIINRMIKLRDTLKLINVCLKKHEKSLCYICQKEKINSITNMCIWEKDERIDIDVPCCIKCKKDNEEDQYD